MRLVPQTEAFFGKGAFPSGALRLSSEDSLKTNAPTLADMSRYSLVAVPKRHDVDYPQSAGVTAPRGFPVGLMITRGPAAGITVLGARFVFARMAFPIRWRGSCIS